LWRHYFEGSQAIIWLLDSNDPDRFEEAREEVHKLLQSVRKTSFHPNDFQY